MSYVFLLFNSIHQIMPYNVLASEYWKMRNKPSLQEVLCKGECHMQIKTSNDSL